MARPGRQLAEPHTPQLPAERLLGDRDAELLEDPLGQIDQPPTHDAVDGRDRAIVDNLPQGLPLALVEEARRPRCLAGQETPGTLGVEPDHPVAHDLQGDAANPGRIRPRAAIVNLGQRQKTPRLIGITRSPRELTQHRAIEIRAKRKRNGHGKPFEHGCHGESEKSRFGNPLTSLSLEDLVSFGQPNIGRRLLGLHNARSKME
jgi:hypothetical protein